MPARAAELSPARPDPRAAKAADATSTETGARAIREAAEAWRGVDPKQDHRQRTARSCARAAKEGWRAPGASPDQTGLCHRSEAAAGPLHSTRHSLPRSG